MSGLLDTSNVKNIYEHIETQSIKTTLLKLFKKYNFITEQDMLNENVKIYYHKKTIDYIEDCVLPKT